MKDRIRTLGAKFCDKFIDFDEMLHGKFGKLYSVKTECTMYKQYSIPYMRGNSYTRTDEVIAFTFHEAHRKAIAIALGDPLVERAKIISCVKLRNKTE